MRSPVNKPNINTVLFLGPSDVMGVIAMAEAIDLVDKGYADAVKFPIINAPRRRGQKIEIPVPGTQ